MATGVMLVEGGEGGVCVYIAPPMALRYRVPYSLLLLILFTTVDRP